MKFSYEHYERKGTYTVEQVLPFVYFESLSKDEGADRQLKNFDGDLIDMTSDRYRTFSAKGTDCVKCGFKGLYFAKERDKNAGVGKTQKVRFHFNLYGVDEKGQQIMLTKDHIFPTRAGGADILDNMQTLCQACNCKKGGVLPFPFEEALARGLIAKNYKPSVAINASV